MLLIAHCSGEIATLDVASDPRLGACQKQLCKIFKQRFPLFMASVRVGGELYDEFEQQPFLSCGENDTIDVSFAPTDNPIFYDLIDRAPNHAWLHN